MKPPTRILAVALSLLTPGSHLTLSGEARALDESDWTVRCWNGETKTWEDLGLDKMTLTETENGATRVANTSGIHRHAHLVFPATPEGDFTFTIELKGGYELGFLDRAGKDEMLYVELEDADGAPKADDFETYELTREGTRFTIRRDGRAVPLIHFRFDYGEEIVLTLAIKSGRSAEIRSYVLEDRK